MGQQYSLDIPHYPRRYCNGLIYAGCLFIDKEKYHLSKVIRLLNVFTYDFYDFGIQNFNSTFLPLLHNIWACVYYLLI